MRKGATGLAIVGLALMLEACPKPATNEAANETTTNEVVATENVTTENVTTENTAIPTTDLLAAPDLTDWRRRIIDADRGAILQLLARGLNPSSEPRHVGIDRWEA